MSSNEYLNISSEFITKLGFERSNTPSESIYILPEEKGEGFIYEYFHKDGFYVSVADYLIFEKKERKYDIKENCMEIYYFESGDIKNIQNGIPTNQIKQGINVFVNNQRPGKVVYAPNVKIKYVSIAIFEEYITKNIQKKFPIGYFDFQQVEKWKNHNYDTPELTSTFIQLKKNLNSKVNIDFYYESKIGEIFSLIIKNYKNNSNNSNKKILKKDLEILNNLKIEINESFANPPTINELCLMSGMGLTKLKYSFKSAFNQTIFSYINEVRMKRALLFLSNDENTISYVASSVGFKSPGKFSASFKKTYGESPNKYRKNIKIK